MYLYVFLRNINISKWFILGMNTLTPQKGNDSPLTRCAACGKVVQDSDVELTNMCASCEGLEN